MLLEDVIDLSVLNEMLAARYVRETFHPTLPYSILNYTAAAQYDSTTTAAQLQSEIDWLYCCSSSKKTRLPVSAL